MSVERLMCFLCGLLFTFDVDTLLLLAKEKKNIKQKKEIPNHTFLFHVFFDVAGVFLCLQQRDSQVEAAFYCK